ncbi:MAG: hypothetical protein JSS27_02645 [Planctomycetes bacterium]|nr:hypothetical protein [Planctomycetota bacterium]
MKFSELIVLLPCHSLEDFPVHHQGTEAEGLLSAWSALWHPALIAAAAQMPTWFRADAPPEELENRLLIIPQASESLLLAGWASRAKNEGACVLRKTHRRDELIAAALAQLDADALPRPVAEIDLELVADFLALGTAYLLVELLTRQMRYMSNLDEVNLRNEVVAGAQAAVEGNGDEARRHLRNGFEALTEARERFYPVNCYLVDLTLVAPTTVGATLRAEFDAPVPTNLLISGETAEHLARTEPETLAALKLALNHRRVALVGGEYREGELPLLPREAVLTNLQRGIAATEQALGARPVVYGRRRAGLSPILPGMLEQLGFTGALHVTLDDGQFPQSPQCKTRWQGLDTGAIDALCRVPLDARSADSILSFPRAMGESMDNDHVATVCWAHWPGEVSPFYLDLRRVTAYGSPLGTYIALDAYFADTDRPGDLTQFRPDQYRVPYLRQAIIKQQADPISRHARRLAMCRRAAAARAIDAMAFALKPAESAPAELPSATDCDLAADEASASEALATKLDDACQGAITRLAGAAASGATRGLLVANPDGFARRLVVDVSSLGALPDVAGPVQAVQELGDKKLALVETPSHGFAWLAAGSGKASTPAKSGKRAAPMAEGQVLRNELFEVTLHPTNGGIKSVYTLNSRRNRLAQQLSFRLAQPRPQPGETWSDPDQAALYSTMVADEIQVLSAGPACGRLASRGRLLGAEGQVLALFTQEYELWRGSRTLLIDITLDIKEPPRADAWNSYYAARFAWSEPSAELVRGVALAAQPTEAKRIEAPQFVEVRAPGWQTAILTGGLPYHLHGGERMLDTLLVARGETRQKFRLGVSFDPPHPAAEALGLVTDVIVARDVAIPSATAGSGWLFHIDARNVIATGLERATTASGDKVVRLRLLETEGTAGAVRVRTIRPPQAARHVDLLGNRLVDLPIDGDAVQVDLGAFEWTMIELQLS